MSDTMDDILKALEIISSGATNLVNANYNKEIAINKSNQAIKLHKLTQEANNDRHNLTYLTNSFLAFSLNDNFPSSSTSFKLATLIASIALHSDIKSAEIP